MKISPIFVFFLFYLSLNSCTSFGDTPPPLPPDPENSETNFQAPPTIKFINLSATPPCHSTEDTYPSLICFEFPIDKSSLDLRKIVVKNSSQDDKSWDINIPCIKLDHQTKEAERVEIGINHQNSLVWLPKYPGTDANTSDLTSYFTEINSINQKEDTTFLKNDTYTAIYFLNRSNSCIEKYYTHLGNRKKVKLDGESAKKGKLEIETPTKQFIHFSAENLETLNKKNPNWFNEEEFRVEDCEQLLTTKEGEMDVFYIRKEDHKQYTKRSFATDMYIIEIRKDTDGKFVFKECDVLHPLKKFVNTDHHIVNFKSSEIDPDDFTILRLVPPTDSTPKWSNTLPCFTSNNGEPEKNPKKITSDFPFIWISKKSSSLKSNGFELKAIRLLDETSREVEEYYIYSDIEERLKANNFKLEELKKQFIHFSKESLDTLNEKNPNWFNEEEFKTKNCSLIFFNWEAEPEPFYIPKEREAHSPFSQPRYAIKVTKKARGKFNFEQIEPSSSSTSSIKKTYKVRKGCKFHEQKRVEEEPNNPAILEIINKTGNKKWAKIKHKKEHVTTPASLKESEEESEEDGQKPEDNHVIVGVTTDGATKGKNEQEPVNDSVTMKAATKGNPKRINVFFRCFMEQPKPEEQKVESRTIHENSEDSTQSLQGIIDERSAKVWNGLRPENSSSTTHHKAPLPPSELLAEGKKHALFTKELALITEPESPHEDYVEMHPGMISTKSGATDGATANNKLANASGDDNEENDSSNEYMKMNPNLQRPLRKIPQKVKHQEEEGETEL